MASAVEIQVLTGIIISEPFLRFKDMIAISNDPLLLNWSKLTDAPVIKLHSNKIPSEVRVFDPCIWKQGKYYYSLSGGTLPHLYSGKRTRANFLFRSSDLT